MGRACLSFRRGFSHQVPSSLCSSSLGCGHTVCLRALAWPRPPQAVLDGSKSTAWAARVRVRGVHTCSCSMRRQEPLVVLKVAGLQLWGSSPTLSRRVVEPWSRDQGPRRALLNPWHLSGPQGSQHRRGHLAWPHPCRHAPWHRSWQLRWQTRPMWRCCAGCECA